MFPLKVVLVSVSSGNAGMVTEEATNLGAQVERRFDTVQQTIESLQQTDAVRHLFITEVRDEAGLGAVRVLNDAFPGEPVLLLTDQADNAAFVHDAMRAGASQVVSPTLAEDFRVALERVAHQFGLDHHKSRVVAVIGSTEGCGSTTIALNLAAEAATVAKVPTILMETGARLGRLAVLLNLKPHYTTQDLLSAPHLDLSAVRRAAAPVGDNLKVIVGPYQSLGPEPSSDVTLRLVALLRRLADFVVLDLPYTFDEDVFAILAAADDVVVVAEPKIPSVHAAMLVKDALAGRKIAALQHFVVNRYVTDSGGASISQIKDLLGEQHLRLVRNHGAAMLEAANRGVPLRDVDPDSPAREDLVSLLGELLHEPTLAKRCHPDNDWLRPVRRFIRWCTA